MGQGGGGGLQFTDGVVFVSYQALTHSPLSCVCGMCSVSLVLGADRGLYVSNLLRACSGATNLCGAGGRYPNFSKD
jgi:hypothetical protein